MSHYDGSVGPVLSYNRSRMASRESRGPLLIAEVCPGQGTAWAFYREVLREARPDPESLVLALDEVAVLGDWAFMRLTGRGRWSQRADGKPEPGGSRHFMLLRKGPDGSWKIARDIETSSTILLRRDSGRSIAPSPLGMDEVPKSWTQEPSGSTIGT